MTLVEMRAFLAAHVVGFDPASTDAAVVAAYAVYQDGVAALEPLTIDEVRFNLRVDGTTEDALIGGLIVAGREYIEDYTGLVLTPRTVTETSATLGRWIDLSSWPVRGVVAIRYPVAGVLTALAPAAWQTSYKRRPVRILPTAAIGWGLLGSYCAQFPVVPVEIDVQAGFATPADVPAAVKQAMHLMIAHLYTNRAAAEVGARAAAVEVPFGVEALLRRWRLAQV